MIETNANEPLPQSEASQPPADCLLTVSDVMARLAVGRSCVYGLISSGQLPSHRIGNGRGCLRVSQRDLQTYLARCRLPEQDEKPSVRKISRLHLKHLKL